MTWASTVNPAARAKAVMFVVAAFALGQAVQINNGMLHPAAIAWLGLAIVTSLVAMLLPPERLIARCGRVPLGTLIGICLTIQWMELTFWGVSTFPIVWFASGMLIAGVGAIMILQNRRAAMGIGLLIIGHSLAGACVIHSTPKLRADVWHFQQQSTAALLHGENPYGVRYRNPYHPDTQFFGPGVVVDGWLTYSYPYPPLTALLTAPARLLGDVRWAYLIALELSAVVIALTVSGRTGYWASAMLLLMPRSLLVIMASWTEPMVVLMLALVLFCAMRMPRRLWLALGLLLAIKQFAVLLIPLTPLLLAGRDRSRDSIKLLLRAGVVAATITLPFMLWDPTAFVRSVLLFQFRQPFRLDALSFPALLAHWTGFEIGASAGFLAAGAMLFWCVRRAPRSPASFAGATSAVLLLFFAFNKQAFCNYYFLVSAACLVAGSLMLESGEAIAHKSLLSAEIEEKPPEVMAGRE